MQRKEGVEEEEGLKSRRGGKRSSRRLTVITILRRSG